MVLIKIGATLLLVGIIIQNVEAFIVGGIILSLGMSTWFVDLAQQERAKELGLVEKPSCPPHSYSKVVDDDDNLVVLYCTKCKWTSKSGQNA